tara:strand:+ start:172 stop:519 length:348 start_codon:yes stop_codon:yes gene_type:complete
VGDKVYYDESCHVCSWEINTIRTRAEACGIEFIDISSGDFKGNVSDYEKEMVGEFNSQPSKGPETFRLMYEKMGFRKAVWFSRLPLVRPLFNTCYYVFAFGIRPYLPKKGTSKNE